MRVFVTGGTGMIGTQLIRALRQRGDRVELVTRRPEAAEPIASDCDLIVPGNPAEPGPWQDAAAGCDAIVNLAGESVLGRRWSSKFKALLRESRVKTTDHCARAIARHPHRHDGSPKVLVSASAIGYYGFHGDEKLDESSPGGSDFLAQLCADWEKAARPAADAGARLVHTRIGVVLAKQGGALKKMLLPFKLGGGGPVGSGRQYLSWVHHADVIGLLLLALDTPAANGPMNVTAPTPETNKQFGQALGRALGRPSFVWTPGFMLKLLLGGGAEVVINGQRVLPKRALEWGYKFRFPTLDAALADILNPAGK